MTGVVESTCTLDEMLDDVEANLRGKHRREVMNVLRSDSSACHRIASNGEHGYRISWLQMFANRMVYAIDEAWRRGVEGGMEAVDEHRSKLAVVKEATK